MADEYKRNCKKSVRRNKSMQYEKDQEVLVISKPDAVINPNAVVVESFNAFVAGNTMLAPCGFF